MPLTANVPADGDAAVESPGEIASPEPDVAPVPDGTAEPKRRRRASRAKGRRAVAAEAGAEDQPAPATAADPDPVPEPEPETGAEPEPETESSREAEPEPGPEPEVNGEPEPESESEPEPEFETGTGTGTESAAELHDESTEGEQEPEGEADAAAPSLPEEDHGSGAKGESESEAQENAEPAPEAAAEKESTRRRPKSRRRRDAPPPVHFLVSREKLAQAVAWVARCLPQNPVVPTLSGIRLDLAGGKLKLSAYDYEASAEMTIDVSADGSAELLLPGHLLAEITKALPDEQVNVSIDGTKTWLACGDANFTLLTMPVEDYPDLPEMPSPAGRCRGAAFAAAVSQTAVAAGKDETLAMLTGLRLEIDGDKVTMAATDRFRLAVSQMSWQPAEPAATTAVVVPARLLSATAKSFAAADEVEIGVSRDDEHGGQLLGISGAGRRATVRLLEPTYPEYRNFVPPEFSHEADVSTAQLLAAVKRVTLVADRGSPVRLSFHQDNSLMVSAGDGESHAFEKLPVEWPGETFTIAFNYQMLLDGLSALPWPVARFQMTAPTTPAVLVGVVPEEKDGEYPEEVMDDYSYLIMPMRLP